MRQHDSRMYLCAIGTMFLASLFATPGIASDKQPVQELTVEEKRREEAFDRYLIEKDPDDVHFFVCLYHPGVRQVEWAGGFPMDTQLAAQLESIAASRLEFSQRGFATDEVPCYAFGPARGEPAISGVRAVAIANQIRAMEEFYSLILGVGGPEEFGKVQSNDPWLYSQWYLDAVGIGEAWDFTHGDPTLAVAVVDSGLALESFDFGGRIAYGHDFLSSLPSANDGDGRDPIPVDPGTWITSSEAGDPSGNHYQCAVKDSSWHGTAVTGIFAAERDDGIGIAGINSASQAQTTRALGRCDKSPTGFQAVDDLEKSIVWAVGSSIDGIPDNETNPRVINISVGTTRPRCPDDIQAAINRAREQGKIVVVAAGNRGAPAGNYTPDNCKGVLVVGASTESSKKATYSNTGSAVSLMAPSGDGDPQNPDADDIGIMIDAGTRTPTGTARLAGGHGTSFSAPIVAGVASLMASFQDRNGKRPGGDFIKSVLNRTARLPPDGRCPPADCGAGVVDAAAAVRSTAAMYQFAVREGESFWEFDRRGGQPTMTEHRNIRSPVQLHYSSGVQFVVTQAGELFWRQGGWDFVKSEFGGVRSVTAKNAYPTFGTGANDLRIFATLMDGTTAELIMRYLGASNGYAPPELVSMNSRIDFSRVVDWHWKLSVDVSIVVALQDDGTLAIDLSESCNPSFHIIDAGTPIVALKQMYGQEAFMLSSSGTIFRAGFRGCNAPDLAALESFPPMKTLYTTSNGDDMILFGLTIDGGGAIGMVNVERQVESVSTYPDIIAVKGPYSTPESYYGEDILMVSSSGQYMYMFQKHLFDIQWDSGIPEPQWRGTPVPVVQSTMRDDIAVGAFDHTDVFASGEDISVRLSDGDVYSLFDDAATADTPLDELRVRKEYVAFDSQVTLAGLLYGQRLFTPTSLQLVPSADGDGDVPLPAWSVMLLAGGLAVRIVRARRA